MNIYNLNQDLNEELLEEANNTELHIPGYKYCGPGTRVVTRLMRGDKGINQLDEACRRHDVDYDVYAGDDNGIQASDSRLVREIRDKQIKGFASWLVERAFAGKRTLENLGMLKKSKFSGCNSKSSCDRKHRVGKYLLKHYFNST